MVEFTFVASVGWKRYPDGTDADVPFLMENLTDYDPNEDHICGGCGAAVPGRFLCCCAECWDVLELLAQGKKDEYDRRYEERRSR
jgi:hypothetical protein